jgi:uncharacterized membrane protein
MSRHGKDHASERHPGSSQDSTSSLSSDPSLRLSHDRSHELASEHRPGLLPEDYFRWRGGEITRLEAFCDVVFGFALTLLVVSLEVPHTYAELMAAMRGFLPFAVCFAQLVMIWRTHYVFSRRYGLEDPYSIFLSMVLLFLVLFYVYPLKFVFTLLFAQLTGTNVPGGMGLHEASVLMRIYGGGFAAVFLLFVLMHVHAYKLRWQLGLNEIELQITRVSIRESLILAAAGVISFVIAFWSPEWAGWSYFLLGPTLAIHGTVFGKRTRLLTEKLRAASREL